MNIGLTAVLLAALGAPAWAADFELHEISAGVFVHPGPHEEATPENLGAFANHGFIIGEKAVAVIDPGGSLRGGQRVLDAIAARTALPVRYVIATHDHPDHSFGAAAFADAQFIGHARLAGALARRGQFLLGRTRELLGPAAAGTVTATPTRTVAIGEVIRIDLGNRPLDITAWPTAHTDNDVTVVDVNSATLWSGDLVFVDRMPIIDGSLLGWLEVMAALRRIEVERVVPGHGPTSVPWPDALEPQARYLNTLRERVRGYVDAGTPLLEVVQAASVEDSTQWLLYGRYHARNVTVAYKELEWE